MISFGSEGEEMIKCRHPIDPARRLLEAARDVQEKIILQKAENLLGRVQHLQQGIRLVLVPFHGRIQHLEAVVAAGMVGHRIFLEE